MSSKVSLCDSCHARGVLCMVEQDLTTWPNQKYVFYKVTTSAIRVQVKAHANAMIYLAKEPGIFCQYSIAIKPNFTNKVIVKFFSQVSMFNVPLSITNPLEYKNIDISWNEGKLSLQGEEFGFEQEKVGPEILYISFGVISGTHPVHWKFQLTPYQVTKEIQQITLRGLPNHNWVKMTVDPKSEEPPEMPEDALIGGYEEDRLYIIRAEHRNSLTPGKFCVRKGFAFVPWGGDAVLKSEFEVLCSINCKWVKTSNDIIPVDALEAGYSEVRNERLYIGRAYHLKHLVVGKVQPSHSCCYIPYDGEEICVKYFEVLVECKSPSEKYAANSFAIPECDVKIPQSSTLNYYSY